MDTDKTINNEIAHYKVTDRSYYPVRSIVFIEDM
jgi:hypothetical protein